MQNLKPCPFCGSDPIYIEGHSDFVECPGCHATGPNPFIVGGMNRVVEAWNLRAESNPLATSIPMPQNRDQAEKMLLVGQRWLDDNGGAS